MQKFYLQQSEDGVTWKNIETFDSKGAADGHLGHLKAKNKTNYRIKAVDFSAPVKREIPQAPKRFDPDLHVKNTILRMWLNGTTNDPPGGLKDEIDLQKIDRFLASMLGTPTTGEVRA